MTPITEEDLMNMARLIVQTGCTVRHCAGRYHFSKSAVHKALGKPLLQARPALYLEVRKVMEEHKATKHLRGGEATKQKYLRMQMQKEKSDKIR